MVDSKYLAIFSVIMLFACTKNLVYQNHDSTSSVEVILEEAGQLEKLLTDYDTVERLTVTGPLNGTDIKFIRSLCGTDEYGHQAEGCLKYLDLENAVIEKGGAPYYYYEEMPLFQECNVVSCYSFAFCNSLCSIVLPSMVERISSQAFYGCSSLETIIIPDTVMEIQKSAFAHCIYNHRTTKTNQKYPSVNL